MMFKSKKLRIASASDRGVVVEDISKQLIPITGRCKLAVVLHNVIPPEECASLIQRAEDAGFDDALIQDENGRQILRQDIRRCGRCIIDDASLAEAVYERILGALEGMPELKKKIMHAPWITSSSSSSSSGGNERDANNSNVVSAVGLNERMRFLRYMPGHFFSPHQDLRYVRGPDCGLRAGETSYITVQLYLNDSRTRPGFKGGATQFLSGERHGKRHYNVKPKQGSVLIFDHDLVHEGSIVTEGIKYSVRTDIMFATHQRR
ncbi:hypothetical protein ACHAW5_006921 [Stephanodiscus triporus]|uniref:Fe2OG dioxygenase domain-containing protein n=1 Tax=Stephanodiscus triporus TaxID=2934178 RepID=A0ABD3NF26_9STRA